MYQDNQIKGSGFPTQNLGGQIKSPPSEQPMSPVADALCSLRNAIETAHDEFRELRGRLDPVKCETPSTGGIGQDCKGPSCSLEGEILSNLSRVQQLRDYIHEVRTGLCI